MQAQVPVDVQAARLGEHHRVARGAAAVGVGARVVVAAVGLDLGDAEGDVALGRAGREVGAEQVAGDDVDARGVPDARRDGHDGARTQRRPGPRAVSGEVLTRPSCRTRCGRDARRRPRAPNASQADVGPFAGALAREVRGLVGHPRHPVLAGVVAVARQAAFQPQVGGRLDPDAQEATSSAARRAEPQPSSTSRSGTGHVDPLGEGARGPVVALVAARPAAAQRLEHLRRQPRPERSLEAGPPLVEVVEVQHGRRPAAAAAIAAAAVVLPEPAGPSTQTSRTGPSRGGAARAAATTEPGRQTSGRRPRPEVLGPAARVAQLLGDRARVRCHRGRSATRAIPRP